MESESAHGGYWWPLGLLNGATALAGLLHRRRPQDKTRRVAAALVGALSSAGVWDDTTGGSQWFRRALLPRRTTFNVVAQAGDHLAKRTVVLIAHHDAAHSGLVFHPALGRLAPRLLPRWHARSDKAPPIMAAVWLGPLLVTLGALLGHRRPVAGGVVIALGTAAAMANIGSSAVVPGASDNLAAVAVLLAVARSLNDNPVSGVRVLLVSTGSEESILEGMRGFAGRHFADLDREHTEMLCLECLGGPILTLLDGEGMLRMRDYPLETREAVIQAAREVGVAIPQRLRTVLATDALIALRSGYRVATLASMDHTKLPANYHWPSDTPDNLVWETIEDAIAVSDRFVRSARKRAP